MKQLLVFALILIQLVHVRAQEPKPNQDLQTIADAYHRVHGFTGNILVIQEGTTLLESSHGLADRSFGIANGPDTRFSINSISKTFTALGILQLAEAKKLDLHAPISKYLPEFDAPWASFITTHQLLTHTSGLPRESGVQATDVLTFNHQLQLLKSVQLLFTPGERYEYSNAGVIVLGALLEAVSKQAYGSYMEAQVLKPMGLKNTGYYFGRAVVQNQATPYRFTASGLEFTQRSKHYGDNAGGGLYSNPRDLYKYVTAISQHKVLSEEYTRLLFKEHVQSGETDREGYAWSIKYFGEEKIHFAAGSGYGTKSVLIHIPATNDFIAITANWGNTPILQLLRDLYLSMRGAEVQPPTQDILADPEEYSSEIGTYLFEQQALTEHLGMDVPTMKLQEFDGKLFLDDDLLVAKNGLLYFSFTDELSIDFENGQMIIKINGNTVSGKKVE